MTIWKMIAHHNDRDSATAWTRKNGRIAIGWGRVGDISKYRSSAEIRTAIRDHYPAPPNKRNAHLGAPSLWEFYQGIQKEDFIIVKGGKWGSLVVKVVGDYEYVVGESPLEGDYQNQRRVQVTALDPEKVWRAAGEAPGTNIYQTLVRCARSVDLTGL
jgi:predicted Mrr-cat superfamily restriction endonuclease